VVNTLSRENGSWIVDGFEVGQVIFIDGIAGGFTIDMVTELELILAGAAIHECVLSDTTITITRTDITKDVGSAVGGDHFIISGGAGPDSPLVVYGDTSQDGAWYSGHSFDRLGQEFGEKPFDPFPHLPDGENEDNEWVFPLANAYSFAGNDIIDASQLFAGVLDADMPSIGFTAYGGAGNDLIIGSQAGDHLAGGSGDDTILGQRGVDHIYGDSGVNVNIFTRALDIVTIDVNPAPTIDPDLGSSDQTFAPVRIQFPVSDNLIAGRDFIEGDGRVDGIDEGISDLQNVIFGDHGEVVQFVHNPNEPDLSDLIPLPLGILPVLQKIQTTELSTILEINSLELQNGADDIIYGTAIADIIIGGAGNDMIDGAAGDDLIFGDNVFLTRMGIAGDENLIDDISNLRFQTLLGSYLYSRSDRALPGLDPDLLTSYPGEFESGVLLTDDIARNYRDPSGPQWWAEYKIDYKELHTFDMDSGNVGVGSFGNDYIAGGADHDTIFGQLGHDVIQGDGSIDSAVAGADHVGAARAPGGLEDPLGPLTVIASFEDESDGQDYIEGGGGKDVIFGGLGQDDLVGGSSTFFSLVDDDQGSADAEVIGFYRPDLKDTIFGGAGTQIDRNNGFDQSIDGGLGDEVYLVTDGTPFENRHARDSDAIVGDNGNIIRIVGINSLDPDTNEPGAAVDVNYGGDGSGFFNPNSPLYVSFNYDRQDSGIGEGGENRGDERIIVRGVTLLDYTPGGPDFAPELFDIDLSDGLTEGFRNQFGMGALYDIGGNDEVHGGTGDDFIYLGGGNDIAFGDAGDDDIIGGWGHDWISGGTGIDGILGDDGRIFTSRNTADVNLAESLFAVDSLIDRDPDTRTSQGDVLNELIRTPGNVQTELINVEFKLKKSVDLTPYNPTGFNVFGGNPQDSVHLFADDIIFGGLGGDFLHGGAGDDAISGAEALNESYAPRIVGSMLDDEGQLRDIMGLVRIDFSRPHNPNHGNVLLFGADTNPWNDPKPVRSRLGEFYLYDEYDPRRVILFHEADVNGTTETVVWNGDIAIDDNDINGNPVKHYFLNNADDEGVSELGFIVFNSDGQTPDPDFDPEYRQSDGDDSIFGDLGNDWIVGGTGRDRAYGGFGNDLLQADDVLGGPGATHDAYAGLNDGTDTHFLFEDRFFGGGGLDILIGNTKGDRLIDWVGEFNSFIVPFAPFGIATVSRQVPPHLFDFLYAQAFGDGVDITRTSDTGEVNHKDKYSNVALLMGGVDGEIGLVTQKDHGYWQDQTGGPTDPQAGNIPGGRRDVLRTSDFNNKSMDLFIRDTGNFTPAGGQLLIAADSKDTQATAVYNLDAYLPIYYEVSARFTMDKPTKGAKANAFVIFDYQSDIDFKYAGLNVSTNKIEMGYRDATGWHEVVQSTKPVKIKPGTAYDVVVAVNGINVTLAVSGVNWFTYDYDARVDEDGLTIPLNKGYVGIGMDGGSGKVDNFTVQVLPPEITLEVEDDFSSADAASVYTPIVGNWVLSGGQYSGSTVGTERAISLADLGSSLSPSSILELEATIAEVGVGGIVFDYYGLYDYKFVVLNTSEDIIQVGHVDQRNGITVDQTYSKTLDDLTEHSLKLAINGAAVNITVDNAFIDTFGFNAGLVDGSFGLI